MKDDILEDMELVRQISKLIFEDKFLQAEKLVNDRPITKVYSTLTKTFIATLKALFTLEMSELLKAEKHTEDLLSVILPRRKHGDSMFFSYFFKNPDYLTFSDIQLHAELIFAISIFVNACLSYFTEKNVFVLLRGGARVHQCYCISSKLQELIDVNEEHFKSILGEAYDEYRSYVYLISGSFYLFISIIPENIMKITNFIGMVGNMDKGLEILVKAYDLKTLISPICCSVLVTFNGVIQQNLGLILDSNNYLSRIFEESHVLYKDSSIFKYYEGKHLHLNGDLHQAIYLYKQILAKKLEWRHVDHLVYWELIFAYCMVRDWENVSELSFFMAESNNFSKSQFYFLKGCADILRKHKLSRSTDSLCGEFTDEVLQETDELFNKIPALIRSIMNKSIPVELFCLESSTAFLKDRKCILPVCELLYVWNWFPSIARNEALYNEYIERIGNVKKVLKEMKFCTKEDFFKCKLLKAALMANRFNEVMTPRDLAKKSITKLEKVYRLSMNIKNLRENSACACYELAYIYTKIGKVEKSLSYVKLSRSLSKGTYSEDRLSFKLHSIESYIKKDEL